MAQNPPVRLLLNALALAVLHDQPESDSTEDLIWKTVYKFCENNWLKLVVSIFIYEEMDHRRVRLDALKMQSIIICILAGKNNCT